MRHPLLAYYVGAYGPTIRIDTQTLGELIAVGRLFGKLASGEVKEQDFGKALACRLDSIHSLIAQAVPEHRAKRKALDLRWHSPQGPAFVWLNSYEDWLGCEDKAKVLIRSDSPGHQYLTREGLDDALVELCYKE